MIDWYRKNKEDILKEFEVSTHGLSEEKVQSLRQKHGLNKLPESKRDSVFKIFLRQFQNPIIYILLLAGLVVFIKGDVVDSLVIFSVLFINAIVGSIQEGRAQNTLFALRKMVTTYTTLLRDGREKIILAEELVPGDIIILSEGDKIPADARLLEVNNLKIDESSLTGESEPIIKSEEIIDKDSLPISDQNNMVWSGTYVIEGSARAIVVSTGVNTFIGGISQKLLSIDADMPLKKNIKIISKMIIFVVVFVCLFVFVFGLSKGFSASQMFSTSVAIAVSVTPEGLPVVVTIILATGMYRMSKKNALVRKLQAVEALGQAEIIAVDKTGTITLNQMMVKSLYVGEKVYEVSGNGYEPKGDISYSGNIISPVDHKDLLFAGKLSSLISNGVVAFSEENKMWQRISGDPTELAMAVFSQKVGFIKNDLERENNKILEIPFSSYLKYHAVTNLIDKEEVTTVVGAPEIIISKLKNIWKGGAISKIEDSDLDNIRQNVLSMTKEGLRVVAMAINKEGVDWSGIESLPDLCFVGLFGISDSIREEVFDVVTLAKNSGVKVVMITGDHIETAKSIGIKTGIYKEGDVVLTSSDIENKNEDELLKLLPKTSVFARVTPEDKLKIIELYRKSKKVVAMTGDGVNDALSLVAADLGVSMGKIGTEVAKESSDIILQDDNFGNIIHAIEEGRNIYITIKKVIFYLFSTSFGELFTIILAIFLGYPIPILASQIIWLNFVTDGFLVAALAMEPKDKDLLKDNRKRFTKIIDSIMIQRIIMMGLVMMLGSIFMFDAYLGAGFVKASTITLTTLAVFQWFNIFNARFENKSIFTREIFSNLYVWGALLIVISLQLLAVYWGPLQSILRTTMLSLGDWVIIIGVSSSMIAIEEFRKILVKVLSKVFAIKTLTKLS